MKPMDELLDFFNEYKTSGIEADFHITKEFARSIYRILVKAKKETQRLDHLLDCLAMTSMETSRKDIDIALKEKKRTYRCSEG